MCNTFGNKLSLLYMLQTYFIIAERQMYYVALTLTTIYSVMVIIIDGLCAHAGRLAYTKFFNNISTECGQ